MTMKAILLPLEESEGTESMLEAGWLVAERFGSYLEGTYVSRSLPGVVVADIGGYAAATPELMRSFEDEERQRARSVRDRFEAFMRTKGAAPGGAGPSEKPSAAWSDERRAGDLDVATYARLFDLTVVGRPIGGTRSPAMSTLEAILFESGRPILIAPPTPPKSIGKTVLISWNASTETARAVALAMPFLAAAQRTVVLSVDNVMVPGPSAAEAARHLKRNGIPAEAREIAAGGRAGGAAVLEEAKAIGADLLIKGAYTHSRLRHMIFGGATSHILAEADLPVLMAH